MLVIEAPFLFSYISIILQWKPESWNISVLMPLIIGTLRGVGGGGVGGLNAHNKDLIRT